MPKKEPVEGEVVKEKRIAVVNPAEELIAQAIDKGTTVEVMKELMSIRREFKQEQMREDFNRAMSDFQSECPIILKTKTVSNDRGKKLYAYAPIDSIVEQVRPLLTKHGLSYTFDISNAEKFVTATCTVTHIKGHSVSKQFGVPIGTGTNLMSAPQLYASAQSFASRYALMNSLGIATGNEDTDASKDTTEPPMSPHNCVRCAKSGTITELSPDELFASEKSKMPLCHDCLLKWDEKQLSKQVTP